MDSSSSFWAEPRAGRAHGQTALVQDLHGRLEPLADLGLSADYVTGRDLAGIENQLAGMAPPHAHLALDGPHKEPGKGLFHQKGGDASPGPLGFVGKGKDRGQVGDIPIGDEVLPAAQDPFITPGVRPWPGYWRHRCRLPARSARIRRSTPRRQAAANTFASVPRCRL